MRDDITFMLSLIYPMKSASDLVKVCFVFVSASMIIGFMYFITSSLQGYFAGTDAITIML